jgi:hypothetical protein
LLQFCADHDYQSEYLVHIRASLDALTKDDIDGAVGAYRKVPLGGMGCFNDWGPTVLVLGESDRQARTAFDRLTRRWSNLMAALGAPAVGGA